ncbi:hypothetical protein NEDG_02175 [Nematocida displodere]|uniref:Uncharacterized protein n=1 Tax=Nematocida displodere TaxID=1805483 RepID=A0A177EKS9_9MICR|nr:hypothetical protein NEDG_02175 [Nematocida displodere]
MELTYKMKQKRWLIRITACVLVALAGTGLYFLYQSWCSGHSSGQEETEPTILRRQTPVDNTPNTVILSGAPEDIVAGSGVEKYDDLKEITEEQLEALFEKENIIPTRYLGPTEEKATTKGWWLINKAYSTGSWLKSWVTTPEKKPAVLTSEEKKQQIEHTRIIKKGFEVMFINQTNNRKSIKKAISIEEIDQLLRCGSDKNTPAVFSGLSSIETNNYRFWTTVYNMGGDLTKWMAFNCGEEELSRYSSQLSSIIGESKKNGNVDGTAVVTIVKNMIVSATKGADLEPITQVRESIQKKIHEYKSTQPMVGDESAGYLTGDILTMIDVLTYFVHLAPSVAAELKSALTALDATVDNLAQCPEQKMLAQYLEHLNPHNQRLIMVINHLFAFIADHEQYTRINLFRLLETTSERELINIEAANSSMNIYALPLDAPSSTVVQTVHLMLDKYAKNLRRYHQLLNLVRDRSNATTRPDCGFYTAEELASNQVVDLDLEIKSSLCEVDAVIVNELASEVVLTAA